MTSCWYQQMRIIMIEMDLITVRGKDGFFPANTIGDYIPRKQANRAGSELC